MIKYKCTLCKAVLETDDRLGGREERCPSCGGINRVPLNKQQLTIQKEIEHEAKEKRRQEKEQQEVEKKKELERLKLLQKQKELQHKPDKPREQLAPQWVETENSSQLEEFEALEPEESDGDQDMHDDDPPRKDNPPMQQPNIPRNVKVPSMMDRRIGYFIMRLVGGIMVIYFWFFYDTTVNDHYNIGLQQKQMIGILVGLFIALVGNIAAELIYLTRLLLQHINFKQK